MTFAKLSNLAIAFFSVVMIGLTICPASLAQGALPEAPLPTASVEPVSSFVEMPQSSESSHKFWNRQNKILFLSAAALNTADFAITRSNLQNGGRELNPVVRVFGRSTPALALNFAGETAGTVTISYLFHKTGHHKLEHLVSYLNIGSSAGAVTYGLVHR